MDLFVLYLFTIFLLGRPTNSFQQQPFNQRQQYFQQPQQQQRVGDGRNPEINLDSLLYV